MSVNTEFGLLRQEEQIIRGMPVDSALRFEFDCADLKALAQVDYSKQEAGGLVPQRSKWECRFLKKQLTAVLPSDNRKLAIVFKMNVSKNGVDANAEMINSLDILVEGEMLKEIRSILSPGRDDKICLEMDAQFSALGTLSYVLVKKPPQENPAVQPGSRSHLVRKEKEHILLATQDYSNIHLRPEPIHGSVDEVPSEEKYACLNWKLNQPESKQEFFGQVFRWKLIVSKLSLLIKDSAGYDDNSGLHHAMELNKSLLIEGQGVDLEIVTKDNATISCHGCILIAQSPVIDKMLTEGHFVEGSTRKIEMAEWTKEEVNAFLAFLYYGGTEEAVKDASMNLALFKMGDYFEVDSLKKKIREILLKQEDQSISVDVAMSIFGVARLMNDSNLLNKAVDALALRSDGEIQESALFKVAFPDVIGRELFFRFRHRN